MYREGLHWNSRGPNFHIHFKLQTTEKYLLDINILEKVALSFGEFDPKQPPSILDNMKSGIFEHLLDIFKNHGLLYFRTIGCHGNI